MGIKELSQNVYEKSDGLLTDRMMIAVNEIRDGDKVLEVGVGWGKLAKNLAKHKKVSLFAADASESALAKIKDYVVQSQTIDISSEKLKFQDDQFDTVICLEVFEHLQNPYHALLEIQRVLKPKGKLIISVPNYLGGHLMIYPGLITKKFFRSFLKQNGFKIRKLIFWGPVVNKDNVGKLLETKFKNRTIYLMCLRFVQVAIRFAQILTKLLGLRIAAFHWCYSFVCENEKGSMDKPFWIKQLEQTTELKEALGWYHSYYHKKT